MDLAKVLDRTDGDSFFEYLKCLNRKKLYVCSDVKGLLLTKLVTMDVVKLFRLLNSKSKSSFLEYLKCCNRLKYKVPLECKKVLLYFFLTGYCQNLDAKENFLQLVRSVTFGKNNHFEFKCKKEGCDNNTSTTRDKLLSRKVNGDLLWFCKSCRRERFNEKYKDELYYRKDHDAYQEAMFGNSDDE